MRGGRRAEGKFESERWGDAHSSAFTLCFTFTLPRPSPQYVVSELGAEHLALLEDKLPAYPFDDLIQRFYNTSQVKTWLPLCNPRRLDQLCPLLFISCQMIGEC